MTNSTVRLFVGDTIAEPSEKSFISCLRGDLEDLGLSATLYANFFPATNRTRQIDVLIRTDHTTMHVELKGLRQDYPVRARANGHWVRVMPDATERSLESNGGRQARDGTYAISDAMRDMAREGLVPARSEGFYRHIDTVVGIWKVIPPGSDIEVPPHVTVLGYDDLLVRLQEPGPCVPWGDDEWDTFARRLSLYQPDADSEPELARRVQLDIVGDYRRSTRASLGEGLGRLVDLGSTDSAATKLSAADVRRRVSSERVVALVGPSGTGKSFLARHIAVEQLDEGCLVVWLHAGAYKIGQFKDFVAKAMGPHSVESWRSLFRAAIETGTPITIVIDGLNECPTDARSEMLQRLTAFLLRNPTGVLLTSTSTGHLQGASGVEVLRLNEPDERARLEILEAHGAKNPGRIGEQFRTPYELAVAARCEQELPEGASVAEVEAAYIRQFAPTEQVRSGLRALASRMHTRLRTSLSLLDATQVLNAPGLGLRTSQIDVVLDCRLLSVDQHRLRLGHELLGRFLAAEDLVHQSDSGLALGQLLSAPGNVALARTALSIEGDHQRVWQALTVLADPELITAATDGVFGPEVAQLAADATRRALRTVVAETTSGIAEFHPRDPLSGRWVTERQWSETERALLISAGQCLARGRFVEEVREMIDVTDRICLQHARHWRAEGEQQPITRICAGTYSQSAAPTDGRGLGVSYVVRAFEFRVMGRRFSPDGPASGLARRLAGDAGRWSWGRFRLAVMCVDPREAADQEFFSSLLSAAWDAGGYHLRLDVLQAAQYFHDSEEPHRSNILEQIKQFDADHVFLQSAITDVLASFGEIENPVTAEELRAGIRSTITHPEDMDCCARACSIVSCQFEEESIFGPYFEAIAGLTKRERVRLLTMAARGAGLTGSFHLEWTLDELVKIVPIGDPEFDLDAKSVLQDFLNEPLEGFRVHPAAENAWLAVIRGWARFEPALPPQSDGAASSQNNWRLLGMLFFDHVRNGSRIDADEVWDALLDDPAATIPNLARLEHATLGTDTYERPQRHALDHLIEHHPKPLRRLFEAVLDQHTSPSPDPLKDGNSHIIFAMRVLGAIGTNATAALLESHTLDPETGIAAVEAIRQINRRTYP